MRLFGTLTSPYVRAVRFVLADLKLPYTLVETFTDEGQALLRETNPLWKVPTLDLGGEVLWDSKLILDRLLADHGTGSLRAETDDSRWQEQRFRATVDELLSTMIKIFYLRKDGVEVDGIPFLAKDLARARSTLAWLEQQLHGSFCTPAEGFGRTELALYMALDWFRFRAVLPFDEHAGLRAFLDAHAGHPLLVETAPPT